METQDTRLDGPCKAGRGWLETQDTRCIRLRSGIWIHTDTQVRYTEVRSMTWKVVTQVSGVTWPQKAQRNA